MNELGVVVSRARDGDGRGNRFSPAVPDDWRYTIETYLTASTAGSFSDFPIYWLGPSHGGVPLGAIRHADVRRGRGRLGPPYERLSTVIVSYTSPTTGVQAVPSEFTIAQRRPMTGVELAERERAEREGKIPSDRTVPIGNRTGRVAQAASGRVTLELEVDGTEITFQASDQARATAAASNLRRLNPGTP